MKTVNSVTRVGKWHSGASPQEGHGKFKSREFHSGGSRVKLAFLGGEPVNKSPFPLSNTIGEEEKREAMKVLDSGLLSGFLGRYGDKFLGGPMVKRLESAFADYFGVRYAVSMNSATSCLHSAVAALDIGPGDEVIVSPYTMSATASAILMNNAIPVFADINPDIFCIDPKKVEKLITPRTKAILVVHLFGHPAYMDEIMDVAKRHDLKVIEDSAQAPASLYKGKFSGTIGDIGIFSLNYHKTIQTGEGGVLVTNDKKLALKLQLIRNHGEAVIDDMPGLNEEINVLGWNYRLPEIEAAMAYTQLKRLEEVTSQKIKLANYLSEKLIGFDGITPPKVLESARHVYYLYVMKFDERRIGISRGLFVKAVKAEGVPITSGYMHPLYLQSIYQRKKAYGNKKCPFVCAYYPKTISYRKGICPVTERLEEREVMTTNITRIPLSYREINKFVRAIEKVFNNLGRLKKYENSKT